MTGPRDGVMGFSAPTGIARHTSPMLAESRESRGGEGQWPLRPWSHALGAGCDLWEGGTLPQTPSPLTHVLNYERTT